MRVTIDTSLIREVLKLSKSENIVIIANSRHVEIVAQELSKTLVVETQVVKKIVTDTEELGKTAISKRVLELLPPGEVVITDTELISGTRRLTYVKNAEPGTIMPIIQNHILEIPSTEFKQGLTCEYAKSEDTSRPILQGVCISKKDFIALDGYKMSVRSSEFEANEEIVMSPNLVSKLKKAKFEGSIDIYADSDYVEVTDNNLFILGKRLEGKYVSYKSLIPQDHKTEVVLKAELLLNVLKFYKKAGIKLVTLKIENDTLKVAGDNGQTIVEDIIEVKNINGENTIIHFNIIYLIEALKNYKDLATLCLQSGVQPLVIQSTWKLELILPVRVVKK